ncbi:MAG: leucine-rich repeat protein [Coriobacteriales bacterium]
MSFVTELPDFDCICGAPSIPRGEGRAGQFDYKAYTEQFKDFKPSFMGAKQGSIRDLQVTFGGFSPTLMRGDGAQDADVEGHLSLRERSERHQSEYFAAKRRAAELESARASEPRQLHEAGCLWTYTVLDGAEVRVERCETEEREVVIPAQIEGMPVVALAADALANLAQVEEIICADSIQSIGGCAFRGCGRLRRLVLPKSVANFESSWFRHCGKVEELVLPGLLELLKPDIFDNSELKRLVIGEGTRELEPGVFGRSKLQSVEVVDENPYLASDGRAVYSKDGSWLVALAVPVERYELRTGCRALAKRCMSAFPQLAQVKLPRSVESIGDFAFYNTSISEFCAPPALVHIGEKAFFRCSKLERAELNEGLRIIQDAAFSNTALNELCIPSTVYYLGTALADGTALRSSGEDATLRMAGEGEFLDIDRFGALYRKEDDGLHLVRLMDAGIERLEVKVGTRFIDPEACARHRCLQEVLLPDGLEEICQGAFRASRELRSCAIPDSVRVIGDEAFFDSSLEEAHLPAALEFLGENALISYYAHHGEGTPSLRRVTIADSLSQRYHMESSLLLEHLDDGSLRVLLTDCSEPDVRIPREVSSIASYALQANRNVRSLSMWSGIREIGVRGLAIESYVRHIHIDNEEPVEGHECFDLEFPDTPRSLQQLALGLRIMTCVDVPLLYKYYDTVVCNSAGFGKDNGGLKLHEQVARMLRRLEDPVYMTSSLHSTLVSYLHNNILDVCEALARADDRRSIDRLIDLGYITCENLTACIDRIGTVKDAAMTGYLLEIKRRRFGRVSMDFDI